MRQLFLGSAKALCNSLLHLLYPPFCLHCQAEIDEASVFFCPLCQELLDFIDIENRCKACFCSLAKRKLICRHCSFLPPLFEGVAAAFDYAGPAASLVRQMKYGNRPHLAKGMAASLVVQLLRLGWPLPDFIIPVPIPITRLWQRGYNQSKLLAEEMGTFLSLPCSLALKRLAGDYSQAGLSKKQRLQLASSSFQLKKEKQLELSDRTLLLVDDVMTTGTTLRHSAQALLGAFPKAIYALTFCKALV